MGSKKLLIELKRKWFTSISTIGEFFIDDKFICFVLEDFVRPEGEKVFAKTAIPYGKYKVKTTFSNHFKKMMPLIYNQNDLTVRDSKGCVYGGVRIHGGNKAEDTEACLLVGMHRSLDAISGSQVKDIIYKMISEAEAAGKEVELIITDNR